MSGKGSAPRPFAVSNEEYANRWDAIFGKDKEQALANAAEDAKALAKTSCDHKVWTFFDEYPQGVFMYECVRCGKVSTSPTDGMEE